MNIGIMGGTFNPIHKGHIYVAENAYNILRFDKILFIPNNIPPHKVLSTKSATAEQRLEMIDIAIGGIDFLESSDVDIKRGGTSYTIDTLKNIRAMHSNCKLSFIMGEDMLELFEHWKNPAGILELCSLVIVSRKSARNYGLYNGIRRIKDLFSVDATSLELENVNISSTMVRDLFRNGKEAGSVLPDGVLDYIIKNRIYF